MSGPSLVVTSEPSEADYEAILAPLIAYNREQVGTFAHGRLAVLIKDGDRVVGGLYGRISFAWLNIELVVVPAERRGAGLGTQLLRDAEQAARERGCIGVRVDTYNFQAPDFYRRNGYEVFATLPDQPPGGERIFLSKRLA